MKDLFSNLWATHPVGIRLLISGMHPSHHLDVASSLSLGVGYLFFFVFRATPLAYGSSRLGVELEL